MHTITYNSHPYQCRADETVLEALLRQGVNLSFSCRRGSCQVCMLRCIDGDIPAAAQDGLRPVLRKNGYFLPCQCKPAGDLFLRDIAHNELYTSAYVFKKECLSETVCRLLIETDKITSYRAGQFINLCRLGDAVARSYSLASNPEDDCYLELHVQRMPGGDLSNWIFDELNELDEVDIQGPVGECYYRPDSSDRPVLMVATGSGLAPLVGILRDAIRNKHTGQIHIYHEASSEAELYLDSRMKDLSEAHPSISYFPVVRDCRSTGGIRNGRVGQIIRADYPDLSDWIIYLAGSSAMVSEVHADATSKGASDQQIFSDSFDLRDLGQTSSDNDGAFARRSTDISGRLSMEVAEAKYPVPDPELWAALDDGIKLNKILHDFYTIVYSDPRLSPFFDNVTMQRSVEKVYLFLRQIFTGEKVYFGDRPRNAHHWMVISDELFDHREDIMVSCLRDNDIPEHLIKRWRAIEESFRPDIVKSQPWSKNIDGIEKPLEGFEELVLDSGTLCDSCHRPISEGTRVRYHVRIGAVYCPECNAARNDADGFGNTDINHNMIAT